MDKHSAVSGNTIQSGTAIVGLLMSDAIYVGADSLSRDIESGAPEHKQKIQSFAGANFNFATSGFVWFRNGVDMLYQCFVRAFSPLNYLETQERIRKFELLLQDFGWALLREFPEGGMGEAIKIDFKEASISTLIFGAEGGVITAWIHDISFEPDNEHLTPKIKLRSVSRSGEQPLWLLLGHVDKIYELCSFQDEKLTRKRPLDAVAYLLAMQTQHAPEHVGSPYLLIRLTNEGVEDAWAPKIEQISLG